MMKEENIRIWALLALLYLPTFLILLALGELNFAVIFGAASVLSAIVLLLIKKNRILSTVTLYAVAGCFSTYVYFITTHTVYIYNGLDDQIDELSGSLGLIPFDAPDIEPDSHFGIKYRSHSRISSFFIFSGQVGDEELIFDVKPRKLDGVGRYALELTPETIIERRSNQSIEEQPIQPPRD